MRLAGLYVGHYMASQGRASIFFKYNFLSGNAVTFWLHMVVRGIMTL